MNSVIDNSVTNLSREGVSMKKNNNQEVSKTLEAKPEVVEMNEDQLMNVSGGKWYNTIISSWFKHSDDPSVEKPVNSSQQVESTPGVAITVNASDAIKQPIETKTVE